MSLGKKNHVQEKIIDQKKGEKLKRGMRIEPLTKEKVEEETVGDRVKRGDQSRHARNRNRSEGKRSPGDQSRHARNRNRSEGKRSPDPGATESQESGRVAEGPIAPLPEGMEAPIRCHHRKNHQCQLPSGQLPTNEEEWGKWKEQIEGETTTDYLARMRSLYGKGKTAGPKESPAEPVQASSSKAAPKAAAYYEVDGGEWYWWDGSWGDKWEPKKKKKNKHMGDEWEQWYKEHPEEDTESSQTPRRPTEPETPPPAQRLRIRPGQDLIIQPNGQSWTVYMPEVVMCEVEYIISGDDTAWMTKPPAVTGFEEPGQAIHMWEVPGAGGYRRILTRIHYLSGGRICFIRITPLYQKRSTS